MLVFFEFLTVENTHFVSAMPGNVDTKGGCGHTSWVKCTGRRALCVKIKNNIMGSVLVHVYVYE